MKPNNTTLTNRQVRVFVSSTFKWKLSATTWLSLPFGHLSGSKSSAQFFCAESSYYWLSQTLKNRWTTMNTSLLPQGCLLPKNTAYLISIMPTSTCRTWLSFTQRSLQSQITCCYPPDYSLPFAPGYYLWLSSWPRIAYFETDHRLLAYWWLFAAFYFYWLILFSFIRLGRHGITICRFCSLQWLFSFILRH